MTTEYVNMTRKSARCPCGKGFVRGAVVRTEVNRMVRCAECDRPIAEWIIGG